MKTIATVMVMALMAIALLFATQYTMAAPPAQPVVDGIHGIKFNDLNGNGVQDKDEPGIADVKIVLTSSGGFSMTTGTEADGRFWFMDIPNGEYTVREVIPDGWMQTAPADGFYQFGYVVEQPIDGLVFGNHFPDPGIHGQKFNDLNRNGVKDPGEPGIPEWKIILKNGNGDESTTVTNEQGNYWFIELPEGVYEVSEQLPSDWEQTFPPSGVYVLTYVPGQVIDGVDFGNWKRRPGEIHGIKYHDKNGNGHRDAGEPTLPGWEIVLTSEDGTTQTETTNENGVFWFMDLEPGRYKLTENLKDGWKQTQPQGGFYDVMLTPGQIVDHFEFGNWQPDPGGIHGYKFHDVNGNGEWDPDEPGLEGWVINIEGPHGYKDETKTNEKGEYWFMDLPPGDYVLWEDQRDDWRQTYPLLPDIHTVVLEAGKEVKDINFGNWKPGPGSIHGFKFHDIDGDGQWDANEPGLPGWKIVIKGDDGFEASDETDENGRFWFMDLRPGIYRVHEEPQDGWYQTFPDFVEYHTIEVHPGDVIERVLFGNWKPEPGSIHGVKFHDINGNGEWDDNEPTLAGWEIVLTGRNGDTKATTTMADGWYWFENLRPGVYRVEERQQDGWRQTYPTDGAHIIELEPGEKVERAHFGNWKPKPGEIHGIKFHDLNGNGEWDDDEPTLPDWEIVLMQGDAVIAETTTNENGVYWFMDVPAGEYEIWEVNQEGWRQTHPRNPKYHKVVIRSGDIIDNDTNFGNWKPDPVEIHGIKWYDFNGNGERDPNEPTIPGWVIYIVGEDGEIVDTETNENGVYWFMDLAPGKYKVYERQQDGWQQTFPKSPDYHEVVLTPGGIVDGLNFGNWRPQTGSIHGSKFWDRNNNGEWDPGEAGLSEFVVLLVGEGTARAAITNINGDYWIEDLLPGTYQLWELAKWRWTQTYPREHHVITVAPGQWVEDVDFGNRRDENYDFCKIHWDIPFHNPISVDTKIHIFNTGASDKTYEIVMIGLPKGTSGSNADGPDTFDILDPVPVNVSANSREDVGLRIYYPDSFKNGDFGPALFEAVVKETDTGDTFGCRAAVWPVRDILIAPVDPEIVDIPVGDPQPVEFEIANVGNPMQRAAQMTVDFTIHAMTDGEDGNSSIVSLNGLPPGNVISGQMDLSPGMSKTIKILVDFAKDMPDTTSDILLEVDLDGDGEADTIASKIVGSKEGSGPEPEPSLFLPLLVK